MENWSFFYFFLIPYALYWKFDRVLNGSNKILLETAEMGHKLSLTPRDDVQVNVRDDIPNCSLFGGVAEVGEKRLASRTHVEGGLIDRPNLAKACPEAENNPGCHHL